MKFFPHDTRRPFSGMSLVEVTLALGITSFAAIVIMGLLATALGHNSDSSERALLVKIYQNVTESVKTFAETTDPEESWDSEWSYTREAVPCDPTDAKAHYRAIVAAEPSATWPGATSSNAWNVQVEILNLPKDQTIFARSAIFVKEPPEAP